MHHHMKIEQLNEQWHRELIARILSRVPEDGIGVFLCQLNFYVSLSPTFIGLIRKYRSEKATRRTNDNTRSIIGNFSRCSTCDTRITPFRKCSVKEYSGAFSKRSASDLIRKSSLRHPRFKFDLIA